MKTLAKVMLVAMLLSGLAAAQDYQQAPQAKKIQPPNAAWTAKIEQLAPDTPTAEPKAKRRILLFSVATGYYHTVIPHTDVVLRVLGKKTGAFEITQTHDIEMFSPENLAKFDAVVINNTCSNGKRRNLFLDVLDGQCRHNKQLSLKYKDLTTEQRNQRAAELEKNLLDYVAAGKGLVCIHGAITMLNNSPEFGKMVGGSFDFHPPLQKVTLNLVEPGHPLLAAFDGKGFIHPDEPYLFKGAYEKKNFRPLLEMDTTKLDKKSRKNPRVTGDRRYVAWIKPYGKGRVFYVGPSHQPESFETAAMLRFYLDGIQYALGDLTCDDTPAQGDRSELPDVNRRVLRECSRILARINDTQYKHKTRVVAEKGIYHFDCSGFLCYLLGRIAPDALEAVPIEDKAKRQRAVTFHTAFSTNNGEPAPFWQNIARLEDAMPGDFIAWRKVVTPKDGNSGHCGIVWDKPVREPDGKIRLRILDSTTSGHVDDARNDPKVSGLAPGTMWFVENEQGDLIGYHWGDPAKKPLVKQPVAVARLTRLGLAKP